LEYSNRNYTGERLLLAEPALVGEAGPRRDLRQREVAAGSGLVDSTFRA